MKKSNLITGILYVLFGVVCLIVALLIETKLEGILWGFAGAGIFPGIMMMCKYFYWSSPKNKERYEERLENERIELHDELKTKIRDNLISECDWDIPCTLEIPTEDGVLNVSGIVCTAIDAPNMCEIWLEILP